MSFLRFRIILVPHRIIAVKRIGFILRITHVTGKVFIAFQKINRLFISRIPRCVQIVIFPAQLDNVPAVICSISCAGNETAVNIFLQQQPVQQNRIALTNAGAVYGCRIRRILELVRVIRIVFAVVCHMAAHVGIDG